MPTPTVTATAVALATPSATTTLSQTPTRPTNKPNPTATPLSTSFPTATATATLIPLPITTTIGTSVEGRAITSYQFGQGGRRILLVGGIHGGYEANTILLAYQMIDYLTLHPEEVPPSATLFIIPSANPDGQFLITGKEGRFTSADLPADLDETLPGRWNKHGVDLNRNWDCRWSAVAYWRDQMVSGGQAPFSEPETAVLKRFIEQNALTAVIFWHSLANAVYASKCDEPFPASQNLAQIYSDGSGYPFARGGFTYYPITGDATNWLAARHIAAITVEFATHDQVEWDANWGGVTAVLNADHSTPVPFP